VVVEGNGIRRREFLVAAAGIALAGCTRSAAGRSAAATSGAPSAAASASGAAPSPSAPPTAGTPQEILARSTVPVLCFHQLRDVRPYDSAYARTMITPPSVFTAQLQALRDGGYTPVPAAALVDHLQFGTALPPQPVLLSFDDGSATHHSVALPVLRQFGFPAVFFPMTVVLNKPDWLSDDQLRELDRAGMSIGAHTWDHQRLDRLAADQWTTEVDQPKARLAELLGHPVDLIAYPFGVWSPDALAHVGAAGYRAAFQLAGVQDSAQPLLTIRRIMPPPTWDGPTLLSHLQSDF
jgi:peptidoglycan/xylan/chitin deacetylase (PgdA/CDA1 family)